MTTSTTGTVAAGTTAEDARVATAEDASVAAAEDARVATPAGTDLYHEVRGRGPTVLFISGATGDAGHFARVATRLADEFTTVIYDRRGNSRSPRGADPAAAAGIASQADDAAAILRSRGDGAAVVVGTSGGGIIALELLLRHPELVRGAVIHEPPLLALLPDGGDLAGALAPVFELAATDPSSALEQFVRLNTSDAAWSGLAPELRRRMVGNAGTLFGFEVERFVSYMPDAERLRAVTVPVVLLQSREGLPYVPAVLARLAEGTGWPVGTISGHHAPYFDQPEVTAEEIRPVLHELCGTS